MTVRRLVQEDYPSWDRMVAESPQGTLFHTTAWLEAVGDRFALFGCFRGENLVGGASVTEGRILGMRVARAGRLTAYAGFLSAGQGGKRPARISADKEILGEVGEHLGREFRGLSLPLPPQLNDVQPLVWQGYAAQVRYTYLLDIADLERCWGEMDPSRRRNLRKAEKDGLTVTVEPDVAVLLPLVRATYARQGRQAPFERQLVRAHNALRPSDRSALFIVRDAEGIPAAGVQVVWDDRRGYYLVGGIDPARGLSNATALALWTAIRHTREVRGLTEFDFHGSSVPAIERFFRKFGGALVPRFDVSRATGPLRLAAALRRRSPQGQG